MLETHKISVLKHLRGDKKGGWICPPTWKPNLTHQAALRVPEPILPPKCLKKSKLSKHFLLLEQISTKTF